MSKIKTATVFEDEFIDVCGMNIFISIREIKRDCFNPLYVAYVNSDDMANDGICFSEVFHDYHKAYTFCDDYIRDHSCAYEVQEVIIEEYTQNQLENVVKLITLGRYTAAEVAKAEKRFRDLDARIDDGSHSTAHFFRIVQAN